MIKTPQYQCDKCKIFLLAEESIQLCQRCKDNSPLNKSEKKDLGRDELNNNSSLPSEDTSTLSDKKTFQYGWDGTEHVYFTKGSVKEFIKRVKKCVEDNSNSE